MTARNEDFLFAQEALAQGFVTDAQVREGLELQRRMEAELSLDERLAVILVKRGWLAEEQARRVYAKLEPQGRRDQIPGYRLIEMIGRGAMGTVYRAIHLGLQRTVAIKVLRKDLAADPTQVGRLKEEARILASLDHKNVVRALDAGESNGFPYVVMEFVEGESLKDRIAHEGSLPEDVALKIARGLADALERARRMGVVHRDVKPGNVLISRDGEPKLMDLGLAKGPVDLGLTQHGATVGTPQYISPEQAQDPRKADTRSDIYSLGATLYAMLTGRPPFEGSTLAEILTKVLYETPTPIRALNKTVSLETQYLVERMMLKDPSLRYRTPAEVVRDLDQIRGGVSIIPQGFAGSWEGYLLRRRAKRTLVAVGVTLGAAVLIGIGASVLVRNRQAEAARERAERYVAAVLDQTVVSPDAEPEEVRRDVDAVAHAIAAYLPFEPENAAELQARQQELDRVSAEWARWAALERTLPALEEAGHYGQMLAGLRAFLEEARPGTPAHARALAREQRVLRAADDELARVRDEVRSAAPRTLAELIATYRGLRKRIRDRLPAGEPGPAVALGRLEQVIAALEGVEKDLADLRAGHRAEDVKGFLEAQRAEDLSPNLDRQLAALLGRVTQAWRSFEESVPAPTVRELVRAELEGIRSTVDRAAADWQEAAVEELLRRARKPDREEARAAVEDGFDALSARLNRAGFLDLAGATAEAKATAKRALEERERRATQTFEGLWSRVWASLRERDASGIRSHVGAARAEDQGWNRRRIDDLETLADGLDQLDARALAGFKERRRVEGVRLRDGGERQRWEVQQVHADERAVTVRSIRGGTPGPWRKVPLREIDTQSLLEVAELPGEPLPPLAHAVALLSLVPAEEPPDLRGLLARFRQVREDLRTAKVQGSVAQEIDHRLDRLRREQEEREESAKRAFNWADDYVRRKEWGSAWAELEDLARESSPRHLTAYFDQNQQDIRSMKDTVDTHIADQRLQAFFPGAEIRTDGPVTTITLNFETKVQLENFRRDLGRGWAVLEPYVPPEPITPGGTNNRLHLLRGLEATLVRDRPLSLTSPFDPARPITVEFMLYTGASPFFLAIDVDGVMVGVLSADPSAYSERWRFPPGAFPTERGEKAPEVDFYGRGRGVAFHAGLDFGEPERWPDWPEASQGRNWEEWVEDPKKRKELPPHLFAFRAERHYRVKVVRERGRLTLSVDGVQVASEDRPEWATRGLGSDTDPQVRGGTGRLQILSWTPAAIDDLRVSGVVRKKWR